uniref:Ig-like domain-containing protein n=1 Tax=Dicentrarchus labrax TaxID=13489 RepID=A0A8P4KIJ9_DICLA
PVFYLPVSLSHVSLNPVFPFSVFVYAFHLSGPAVVTVVVEEGSDVILPCSLSSKENIVDKLFEWRKDGQKNVFYYDAGDHYNKGFTGQDQQFKGRVSYFSDQLKNGNASIKIRDTKISDSGTYTCDIPNLQPRQTFYIQVVGLVVILTIMNYLILQ